MPNTSYQDAIREAYLYAPASVVVLHTLQITHPAIAAIEGQPGVVIPDDESTPYILVVQDRQEHNLKLKASDPATKLFQPLAFAFTLPNSDTSGGSELMLALDNTDPQLTTFLKAAAGYNEPVIVTYRPYLASDPNTPQMDPPMVLFLRDVIVTPSQITGKAEFADIINKKFPNDLYTRIRFLGLGDI